MENEENNKSVDYEVVDSDKKDNGGKKDYSDVTEKLACCLAYIWILFFLPLVLCPNSRKGKFHANQGLVLLLFTIVLYVVSGILTIVPFLGVILLSVISLLELALIIYGIYNAATDKMRELPLIGKITLIK